MRAQTEDVLPPSALHVAALEVGCLSISMCVFSCLFCCGTCIHSQGCGCLVNECMYEDAISISV